MKKRHSRSIVKYRAQDLPVDTKTNWKKVKTLSDTQLKSNAQTDEDTMFIDEQFWQNAHLVVPSMPGKERITIRIDADVLSWLKKQGSGYQSRINLLLRHCMHFSKTRKKSKN